MFNVEEHFLSWLKERSSFIPEEIMNEWQKFADSGKSNMISPQEYYHNKLKKEQEEKEKALDKAAKELFMEEDTKK